MKYPATAILAVVLCVTLTSCDDPQHGAYKVNRFFGFVSLLAVVAGLVGFAVAYLLTRYVLAKRRQA